MTPRHGLVIGKFYPPHAGHHLLVRTAARICERVSVIVMASQVESIPLARRVDWLREVHAPDHNVYVAGIHDEHPIDFASDAIWNAHVGLMLEATRTLTEEPPDAVFTSESYGPELGRRLGARHVAVDPSRGLVPVSGTAVRADVVGRWSDLAPCVRAYFTWRIVLVGAESTGKTTLAAALAERVRARGGPFGLVVWVPEVGREVTVEKLAVARARAMLEHRPPATMDSIEWSSEDFVHIAREQAAREEDAARRGGPILICDTDAFATGVWHQRYTGRRSPEVEAIGAPAPYHLYLLTHPDDVPFVQDGIRDGEHVRRRMTDDFARRLDETGRRWTWLRAGDDPMGAIDRALGEGHRLSDPIGDRRS